MGLYAPLFWCKCMRYKTVKGYLVNDHIILDNKTLWLTKDSKRKCNGYFLVKWIGFKYDLLRLMEEKEK